MRGPLVFCLNPERNNISAEELRLLWLDPYSPAGPIKDDSVRPDGIGCSIKAWNPNSYGGPPTMELILTEFPDPGGEQVYFQVPNPKVDVLMDDELMNR
jgi:hypothetical protein